MLINSFFYYLVFPGFIFSLIGSSIVCWIDRKLTAKIHSRVGPPWWQNFADFIKLLGKETIIPDTAQKFIFVLSPLIGLGVITFVSTILWLSIFNSKFGFGGDVIVIIYLLSIPSIFFMLGASASGNIISAVGVSREMKLMLSYELPFVTALIVPIIKTSSIKLVDIIGSQSQPVFLSFSGALAFFVSVLCFQAKLGLVPFDVAEAEQEISGGTLLEYSGTLLAIIRVTKQLMFFVSPVFLVSVFMPRGVWPIWIVKYLVVLTLFTLIRNTNPRLKIDQIIKFFWKVVFPISILAVILSLNGL